MRGFGGGGAAFGAFGNEGDDDDDPRFSRPPHHYDEFFKAYSTSMLPGKERLNVSYGGKSEWCVRVERLHSIPSAEEARVLMSPSPLPPSSPPQ